MPCQPFEKTEIKRSFLKSEIHKYYIRELQKRMFTLTKRTLIFTKSKPCR